MSPSPSQKTDHFFWHAGPLLLVLFLDGMGLGLFIPILNELILSPTSHFFTDSITQGQQNFIYGSTIGIFMLCWFFGATLLGDLSDQVGRKKTLLICLIGAFASYLLAALAIFWHSISLLILSRVVAGFTSGSQAIAQAAIVDLSTAENKTRNIGLILFALSLGFVLGPLLSGILSDSTLVSWFDLAVPLYFACAVSLINAFLLMFSFKETLLLQKKAIIKPLRAISFLVEAFRSDKIKSLSIIFLIFILGWSSFYSFIAMFMLKIHHFNATNVSLFMALMGIGFGIGNGILINYVTKRFSAKQNLLFALLTGTIINIVLISAPTSIVAWIFIAPFACCIAIAYSILITLFSNQADANSQGSIMGITGSIMAIVWAVDASAIGLLASLSVYLPMLSCIICLSVAALLINKNKQVNIKLTSVANAAE